MLTASKINNLDYYSKLAVEDYYLSGGEPTGCWFGLGARLLALPEHVEDLSFRRVFSGHSPEGIPLCKNSGDDHRSGWDFTFSAPKSVSVLWAGSDIAVRTEIEVAQKASVEKAIRFLETHAGISRRGHGGVEKEPSVGLIAALFEHSTSRSQDPQLHTHCLIANLAPRADGSWGTVESRYLYQWQKAAGALYRASLAQDLRSMGLRIARDSESQCFELFGIPKSICEHFSKRSAAIKEALSEFGISRSSSKLGDSVILKTRVKKAVVDRAELFSRWGKELDALGLNSSSLGILFKEQDLNESIDFSERVILEKLTKKNPVFRLQDLYEAVAVECQWNSERVEDVEEIVSYLVDGSKLVSLGKDHAGNSVYTTPEIVMLERKLIVLADQLQGDTKFKLPDSVVKKGVVLQERSQGYVLSREQRDGISGVCNTGLDILQGAAGAGKSTSLKAVRFSYEDSGYRVVGAAVARQAAVQLEKDTGIPSRTLASLLGSIRAGQLNIENTVVVVDEAGQVSAPDLNDLLASASSVGAKVILVGEQQQLDAISHAGVLRFLSERQGCARISAVRRQVQGWAREAVMQLRSGETVDALRAYRDRKLLRFCDDSIAARSQLVSDWWEFKSKNRGDEVMILAHKWKDVHLLNSQAREYYRESGMLTGDDIYINCAVSDQECCLAFSVGERVRFTRNDYGKGVTNGDHGVVERLERDGSCISFGVRCDDGRMVEFSTSNYSDAKGNLYLAQAYASTIYSSQGRTVHGDVFVYCTASMDRPASYVAGSRHTENCHWYFSRKEVDALNTIEVSDGRLNDESRLELAARKMSVKKEKFLAVEYLDAVSCVEKASSKSRVPFDDHVLSLARVC